MAASRPCDGELRLGPDAVPPPKGSALGFKSWMREMGSIAQVSFAPPAFPSDVPRGHGETVLLIPGFLAGDWVMARLGKFLSGAGYRVEMSGIAFNAGPTPRQIAHLETRLLSLAEENGPLFLVGQSLGGVFARNLARFHPQAVRHVVTLGTPIHFPVTTPLEPVAKLLSRFHDPKWRAERDTIAMPLPVPLTAIYSERDGIVDWHQCLQSPANNNETIRHENIRVDSSHSAMASHPETQRIIAHALGGACP